MVFAVVKFVVIFMIAAGVLVQTSEALQCNCYSTELSEDEMLERGCEHVGNRFIRTCPPDMVCLRVKGLINDTKMIYFQGCGTIPINVEMGTCPPFVINQNGHMIVGTDCFCNWDFCNAAIKLRGLSLVQLGLYLVVVFILSYYLGGL